MLDKYFNREVISQMTFKEFEQEYKGNAILIANRIDLKAAFKSLGGKTYKKKYKSQED
jgi:hypothetical protein